MDALIVCGHTVVSTHDDGHVLCGLDLQLESILHSCAGDVCPMVVHNQDNLPSLPRPAHGQHGAVSSLLVQRRQMYSVGVRVVFGQFVGGSHILRAAAVPVKAVVHRLFIGRIAEIVTKEHAVAQRAVVAVADSPLPTVAAAQIHLYGDAARRRLLDKPVIPVIAAALFPLLQLNGEGEVNILVQHGELKAVLAECIVVIQRLQGLVRPSGLDGLIAGMPSRQRHTVPRPVLLYIVNLGRDNEHSVMVRRELIHAPTVIAALASLVRIGDVVLLLH